MFHLLFFLRNNEKYSKYEADRRKRFNDEVENLKHELTKDCSSLLSTKVDVIKEAIRFIHHCRVQHNDGMIISYLAS